MRKRFVLPENDDLFAEGSIHGTKEVWLACMAKSRRKNKSNDTLSIGPLEKDSDRLVETSGSGCIPQREVPVLYDGGIWCGSL